MSILDQHLIGSVHRVAGPVIEVAGLEGARLFDVVRVGEARLPGEIIRLANGLATVQVFEETTGLRVGEPVVSEGEPLAVELGPGLLGGVFDGTQRPLRDLHRTHGIFIPRGSDPHRLNRDHRWAFRPTACLGTDLGPGDELGVVQETAALTHRILVPPGTRGVLSWLAEGELTIEDPVATVGGTPVTMLQRWPVRQPRPVRRQLALDRPLLTGQRVLDTLFPVARGGTAIIPGGFGTGKTVLEQAVAKFSAADVVVYVGCGERGNELTEVLEDFPTLQDPRTGAPLMDRTVLIANTSNMPVAAREASVYVGMTIAEYYRDQGYDAVLLADSTSRWGEALREVSSRLEEIPAEDGYPAYLATRLSAFYERAGAVECLGDHSGHQPADGEADGAREGSVTVVGAVSPAGGDFSEPVTQNSLRVAGCFWGLDTTLARQRHFPSISWSRSYTSYRLDAWFDHNVTAQWSRLRAWALATLAEEGSLQEVAALLGIEALAAPQRVTLRVGRVLREDFLQQSSFDELDATCPPVKQVAMLAAIHEADHAMRTALNAGAAVGSVVDEPALSLLGGMRRWPNDETTTDRGRETGRRIEAALGVADAVDDTLQREEPMSPLAHDPASGTSTTTITQERS